MSSYMRSIKKMNDNSVPATEYTGALHLLIGSPRRGEPWFIYFLKAEMSKNPRSAFQIMKKFIKDYKHDDYRWSFTFDKIDRWHSVSRRPARPAHTSC